MVKWLVCIQILAANRNKKALEVGFKGLGWKMGLEPTTPRITIWCSNRLSYNHRVSFECANIRRK